MIFLKDVQLPLSTDIHPSGKQTLSLHFKRRHIHWITGKKGSGKTALLNLLALRHPLSHGTLRIMGYDLKKKKLPRRTRELLHRRTGYIDATPIFPTSLSTFDTIALALEIAHFPSDDIIEETSTIIKLLDLEPYDQQLPHTLPIPIQYLISFARALISRPSLLLIDSPAFTMPDVVTTALINAIQDLTRTGSTVIIATNNHNTLSDTLPGTLISLPKEAIIQPSNSQKRV